MRAGVPIYGNVALEGRLVLVGSGDGDFPVPPDGVPFCEHRRVSKSVHVVFHRLWMMHVSY